jgi:hypothetical protein
MTIQHDFKAFNRFMQMVNVKGSEEFPECWIWTGSTKKQIHANYGRFTYKGQVFPAHRWIYMFFHGMDIDGGNVLHACDNPPCVNPGHLSAGTHRENMLQMIKRKRHPGLPPAKKKLDMRKAQRIRNEYRAGAGLTQGQLARKYSVSRQLIWLVVHNRVYVNKDFPAC